MKRYLYCYQTAVAFSEPVRAHNILLRCLPMVGEHQTVEEEHLITPPDFKLRRATDAFGNRIVYGGERAPHKALAYVSTGIVSVGEYKLREGRIPVRAYLQTTPLTTLSEPCEGQIEERGKRREESGERKVVSGESLCHKAHSLLAYTPFATDVTTTASEALKKGQGVCQDFAHVMIALCRQQGIPARYACGFLEGTGATHAWVEVFDGYNWTAFDPTHDRLVEEGYVKIAHGRDSADCPVSRGIYVGAANEQTEINVTLKEI